MEHKRIEELIQKKLDNEISPDEELLLSNHLADCPDCQKLYFEMVQVIGNIQETIEYYPGSNFNDLVMRRIKSKKPAFVSRLIPVFVGSYIASALFIIFSPLTKTILSKLLFAIMPALTQIEKGAKIVGMFFNSIFLFTKASVRLPELVFGLTILVLVFFIFGKTLKREVKWENSF